MEVLILTIFASLTIVAAGLTFFAWNLHHHSHEHIEQLSLLPLEDELTAPGAPDHTHGNRA